MHQSCYSTQFICVCMCNTAQTLIYVWHKQLMNQLFLHQWFCLITYTSGLGNTLRHGDLDTIHNYIVALVNKEISPFLTKKLL